MKNRQCSQGFTIIEILVAVLMLGIVIIITAQPLLNSLKLSGTSEVTLNGTREVQDVLESARALIVADYAKPQDDLNAMTKDMKTPITSVIKCEDVAPDLSVSVGCADTDGNTPFLRRLTVTTTIKDQTPIVLSVDVRP